MIEDRGEIFPALEIDPYQPGTKCLADTFANLLTKKAEIGMSSTVTDAGWLGRAGIPTVIFGPGKLEDAHSVNEKVEISQLLDFTKILAIFIARWCNTRKGEEV